MLIAEHRRALLRFLLILSLVVILLQPLSAYAHSGGTDSSGGHYNHNTGDYHYHHGFPAHEHPGGKCPYAGKDPYYTNDSSGGGDDASWVIWLILIVIFVALLIYLQRLHNEYQPKPPTVSTPLQHSVTKKENPPAPSSTFENSLVTKPPQAAPKKETPMLQTTIYPSSKPPQTHTYSTGTSDELTKLRNGNEFLRQKVDKLNQQIINTNKENERLKRELSALKEEQSVKLHYDKLNQQKQVISNALLTKENEQLKQEIAALKTELEQEKQRTIIEIPSLQHGESTPEYLKLPDENAYYEALRTSRTQKASSGKLILKQLFGKIYSEYSKKTYTTTLDSCTCDDFHYRKKVCKHMIAFALEIKAINPK